MVWFGLVWFLSFLFFYFILFSILFIITEKTKQQNNKTTSGAPVTIVSEGI